jgi:hypothetical protein
MAGRIDVDTVVDLVSDDVRRAIERLTFDEPEPDQPPLNFWNEAVPVVDGRLSISNNSMPPAWPPGRLRTTRAFGCS